MTYAEEKLSFALYYCLATGEGDARTRLFESFQYHLFNLREEHFNKLHWNRFRKVKTRLTKNGPIVNLKGDVIIGAFENGKNGMRNKTASKLISQLVEIYKELNERKPK